MKKFMSIALPLLMASPLCVTAHAEEVAPAPTEKREQVIEKREQNQEKRIENGVKSGQLTPEEAKRLENEQARVKKMESKAEADGKVTKKEMKKIEKMQDHASNDIYRKKHNRRTSK